MISVEEALSAVLGHCLRRPAVRTRLEQAAGLVLAEDVASDIDSPPHDKSMVDGYAVVAADIAVAEAELEVLEEVTAGEVPRFRVRPGTATRIMTGAPIPAGADAVVMIERTRLQDRSHPCSRVTIQQTGVSAGHNIMRSGTSLRRGDVVLRAGHLIRPIEIGLLAEVGKTEVLAFPPARVSVLATGNELVDAGEQPGQGQIRNSNGPMLTALVERAGAVSSDLGVARDDVDDLRGCVERGLESDVLVLSGGVSAGVLDLVPRVLEQLGVLPVFHKVNLKPGKPLWFGKQGAGTDSTLVFGLPGNPVSSLVCFELFVKPALAKIAGRQDPVAPTGRAQLSVSHHQHGDRATYHPGRLGFVEGEARVETLRWQGSADLRTLVDANCLVKFPQGDHVFAVGDTVQVYPL